MALRQENKFQGQLCESQERGEGWLPPSGGGRNSPKLGARGDRQPTKKAQPASPATSAQPCVPPRVPSRVRGHGHDVRKGLEETEAQRCPERANQQPDDEATWSRVRSTCLEARVPRVQIQTPPFTAVSLCPSPPRGLPWDNAGVTPGAQ